jgi:NADH-quinone oxidoreductase subunit E
VPFTDADRRQAKELIGRYPHERSALLPLLHLAQDRDGWVTPAAMEEIAGWLGLTPALVLGTCSFYSMFKREPSGSLVVSVCTNVSCIVNGAPNLFETLRQHYAGDREVLVEEVECVAACDLAPVVQVNYEFHGPVTPDAAMDVIEQYKRGELQARTMSGSPAAAEAATSRGSS